MAWNGMAERKAANPELLPSFLLLLLGGPATPCRSGSAGRSSGANLSLSPEEEEEDPPEERERDSARIRRHFAIIEMFRLRLLLFPVARVVLGDRERAIELTPLLGGKSNGLSIPPSPLLFPSPPSLDYWKNA